MQLQTYEKIMTLEEILRDFRQRLAPCYPAGEINGMEMAMLDNVLNYSRVDAILHGGDEMPDFIADKFVAVAGRLLKHEPIQYILSDAYFHGHHFHVTPATLIPRPETEQLIDMIADENRATDLRVLDIGTGSGCIAISLARAMCFPQIDAIDISHEALSVAKENAKRLKANVKFIQADILAMPQPTTPSYDIIVSNPPYIADSERAEMEHNVLDYEPHSALFVSDDNPLLFYRAIAHYASAALLPNGKLYLEINSRFPSETCKLLNQYGFTDTQAINDYRGLPRFVTATR